MLISRSAFLFFFALLVSPLCAKEILYQGKYFESEKALSDFLYSSQDYKSLIAIALEGIQSQRTCSYQEPFLQNSIKASYHLKEADLLEHFYTHAQQCSSNIKNSEIYLRYLIETKKFDESYELLELINNRNGNLPFLENRLFQESGRWRYFQHFNTSFVQNSNINNGFTADVVSLFGMPFEVSDDANPIDDIGLKISHSFLLMRYLSNTSQLRLRTNINAEDYSGYELDRYSPFFSVDYIFTPNDLISIGTGRNYWNNEKVFSTKSISYSRKLNKWPFFNMIRISTGKTDSPINDTNSSDYLSLQTYFKLKDNWNAGISYTENTTEFGFSSYDSVGASLNKKFSLKHFEFWPFFEIKKRHYKKKWAAYGVTRSYLQKYLGFSVRLNNFKNLTANISRTSYDSNIVIYDNDINLIELNYSL